MADAKVATHFFPLSENLPLADDEPLEKLLGGLSHVEKNPRRKKRNVMFAKKTNPGREVVLPTGTWKNKAAVDGRQIVRQEPMDVWMQSMCHPTVRAGQRICSDSAVPQKKLVLIIVRDG